MRFDFVGFTRGVESIIVTAVVNIGACGAVPVIAPKKTGSGPGTVTNRPWQFRALTRIWLKLLERRKLLLEGFSEHFYNVLRSRGRGNVCE